MWKCPTCGRTISDESNYCVDCRVPRPKYKKNFCTNPECRYHSQELEDPTQQICNICGSTSTFGEEVDKYC